MFANLACPSLKYLSQCRFGSSLDIWGRYRMNKYIRNTIIEYTAGDSVFAKYENGKTQSKQNTGLQMVPQSRKWRWRPDELFSRCPGLTDPAVSPELLEAKNNTP